MNAVAPITHRASNSDWIAPDVHGQNFFTIDRGLQDYATERLGEESASAVVVDVTNGEVLALASTPTFDPNAFNVVTNVSVVNTKSTFRQQIKPSNSMNKLKTTNSCPTPPHLNLQG